MRNTARTDPSEPTGDLNAEYSRTGDLDPIHTEDGYGQSDPPSQVEWPYRRIAADIVVQALEDARLLHAPSHAKVLRARRAIEWLFGATGARGRALWLAWLDLNEVGLWELMAKGDRFGEANVLPEYLVERARLQCIA